MRKYLRAYNDAISSGIVNKQTIDKHTEQQRAIDSLLPDSASFFYIVEAASRKYHFMGKQQESVSGYSNEEFLSKGIELFLKCLHPDERGIIVEQVYPAFFTSVDALNKMDKKRIQFQYNYRFKTQKGKYRNLLEQIYILEVDENRNASLLLGNVIVIDNDGLLPIRYSAKMISKKGISRVMFSKTYNPAQQQILNITNRELEILRNLSVGKTSKEIAEDFCLSPHTVDTHRKNLLRKLNCSSVVELARIAFNGALL